MKKLFALLILGTLFCSVSAYGAWVEDSRSTANSVITLSTVTLRVREIIDDPNSTNGTMRYSSSTIYGLINTAQRLMCVNTWALTSWATQTLSANTTEYALPSNCLSIERVTIDKNADGTEEYIPYITVHHLDIDKGKQWTVADSSQTPTTYYIRNRYIGIYPVPNNAGAILKIWYVKIPSIMSTEGTYIFDGYTPLEVYWEALASYAAYQILLQEGKMTLLEPLSAIFAGSMIAIKEWITYRPEMDVDIEGASGY